MRALRAGEFQREQAVWHSLVQLTSPAKHKPTVSGGKYHQNFFKIITAEITESSQVFDTGKRIVSLVSHRQTARSDSSPYEMDTSLSSARVD